MYFLYKDHDSLSFDQGLDFHLLWGCGTELGRASVYTVNCETNCRALDKLNITSGRCFQLNGILSVLFVPCFHSRYWFVFSRLLFLGQPVLRRPVCSPRHARPHDGARNWRTETKVSKLYAVVSESWTLLEQSAHHALCFSGGHPQSLTPCTDFRVSSVFTALRLKYEK